MFKYIMSFISIIKNFIISIIAEPFLNKIDENALRLDDQWSQRLTNLFTNTRVSCYIVNDNTTINARTLPGIPSTNTFFKALILHDFNSERYNVTFNFLPIYYINSVLDIFMNIINGTIQSIRYGNGTVSIDPITKKADIGILEVTCYVSSGLINNKDLTQDEIIACLLHEVGHNTVLLLNGIEEFIDKAQTVFIYKIFLDVVKAAYYGIFTNESDTFNTILKTVFICVCSFVALKLINSYLCNKQELYADSIAAQLGYGPAIRSLLKKIAPSSTMLKTFRKYAVRSSDSILEKAMKSFYNFVMVPINRSFATHPDVLSRVHNINHNIKKYREMQNVLKNPRHSISNNTIGWNSYGSVNNNNLVRTFVGIMSGEF